MHTSQTKNTDTRLGVRILVREAGVEPARPCEHWHLKPASLPIPPLAHLVVERCCSAQDVYYHRLPRMSTAFLRKNEKIFILSKQAKNHSPQRFALWGVCINREAISPQNRPACRCPDRCRSAGNGPAPWRWSARRREHQTRYLEAAGDHEETGAAGTNRCRDRHPD